MDPAFRERRTEKLIPGEGGAWLSETQTLGTRRAQARGSGVGAAWASVSPSVPGLEGARLLTRKRSFRGWVGVGGRRGSVPTANPPSPGLLGSKARRTGQTFLALPLGEFAVRVPPRSPPFPRPLARGVASASRRPRHPKPGEQRPLRGVLGTAPAARPAPAPPAGRGRRSLLPDLGGAERSGSFRGFGGSRERTPQPRPVCPWGLARPAASPAELRALECPAGAWSPRPLLSAGWTRAGGGGG